VKLAIHQSEAGFHPRWVAYCEEQGIPFRRVNCHASAIIEQLRDCDGLLWHHSQMNPRDLLVAKAILSALEHSGFRVFPDWRTGWHFDDKVAQKYLFEAIGAPFVPTWVFLDRRSAMEWLDSTTFPKVFKLRGGAGSSNVRLVRNRNDARRLVRRAFGSGFPNYDAWGSLKERWRKFRLGKAGPFEVAKGVARFLRPPPFARALGRETGYLYFQEFIPDLECDYRMIVIDQKCLGIIRQVRKDDFRASGSGHLRYEPSQFPAELVKKAFLVAELIGMKSAAMDFVIHHGEIRLIEVSYGFPTSAFADDCPGYWDQSLNWCEDSVNPYGWMVDSLLKSIHAGIVHK